MGTINSVFDLRILRLLGSAALLACASTSSQAQTAKQLESSYRLDSMELALRTKEHVDLYGIHFDSDKATIQPSSKQLLDDIATTLKNYPDWRLRIVGHTDATGGPTPNVKLSQARADAIKANLIARGVDADRLIAAGLGEDQPISANDTPEGRALNRRVELVRFSDSAEARKMLKAMSDFLAAQAALSFDYDSNYEVVTTADQKLGLAASGSVTLDRPDKIRATRSGGFSDIEIDYDGKSLVLFGKNANLYAEAPATGSIDQLIDTLQDKYHRPLPAADILMSNAYDALMQGVYDAKDLGSGVVNGTECDSVAFRKDEVDWQIWIAQGPRPYPCRFVVTSKMIGQSPQYSIQFRDWKFGSDVETTDFSFSNATTAKKIELQDIRDTLDDMPPNLVKVRSK